MQLSEFPQIFIEMLCTHEAFRRLGYPSSDIFAGIDHDTYPTPQMVVIIQWGTKSACTTMGVPPCTDDEFPALWEKAVKAWCQPENEWELQAYWDKSVVKQQAVQLAFALHEQGMIRRTHLPESWADVGEWGQG